MPTPKEIRPSGGRAMQVLWDDGKTCEYSFRLLRKACPCATCEDMRRSRRDKKAMDDRYQLRLITQDSPGADPVLVRVDWVGNYALRLVWEDGHDSGIYHFEALRELCGKREEDL